MKVVYFHDNERTSGFYFLQNKIFISVLSQLNENIVKREKQSIQETQ